MSKNLFFPVEDEQLIEFISKHEILWNKANADWKNVCKKDLVWEEVGTSLKKTSVECKKRWKTIRDHYIKQRRYGSVGFRKRATYWDRLGFLGEINEERPSCSNIKRGKEKKKQEIIQQEDSETETAQEPKQKRAKTNLNLGILRECVPEDENDLFFRSMAASVKKFQHDLQQDAKKRIFNIVMDLETINRKRESAVEVDPLRLQNSPIEVNERIKQESTPPNNSFEDRS